MTAASNDPATVISATEAWLDRAVIGLNLCPFAGPVRAQGRIGLSVSTARSVEALAEELWLALDALVTTPREQRETQLLIHPDVLTNFDDYLDFLALADDLLVEAGHEGVIQIASFHPDYCFADSQADDPANFSNRSPYPMLHLLREASIAELNLSEDQSRQIYERNIQRLRALDEKSLKALRPS
ncbi:MAG: DUF1415 domain-containing protein [Wenzhouxiangella sp.]